MSDDLKWVTLDVTFCTPNPDRLAAAMGVDCPCQSVNVAISEHTEACPNSGTGLTQAVRNELVCLWDDLQVAIGSAANRRWSIECDSTVDRIKTLTQLVGATPWGDVPITLLENGVYQRVHDDLGIPVSPDMARVAEIRAGR